ncbi:MAG TPA: DUF748 domain-containing protein [Candidatus Tectomicrobia bacterium]|nr:DUF748 domain-containing protein [Candidatus Tectomicrobia bacterium]
MRRRWTWAVVTVAVVILAVAAFVLGLAPLIRWAAARQLTQLTGLQSTIDDVEVVLLERRVVATGIRVARPSGPPLATIDRVALQLRLRPLLGGRLDLERLAIDAPRIHAIRTEDGEVDVAEVVRRLTQPGGDGRLAAIDHLTLEDGSMVLEDRAVDPDRTWRATDIAVEARDLGTGDDPPGTGSARLVLAGAPLTVVADALRIRPALARATLEIQGLDLGPLWVYVPGTPDVRLDRGRFSARTRVTYRAEQGLRAGGDGTVAGLVLVRHDLAAPLLTDTLALQVRDLAYADGVLRSGRIELRGSPSVLHGVRAGAARVEVDPAWLVVEDLAYPGATPARLALELGLPGGGRVTADGTIATDPARVEASVRLRDIALALAGPYLPADAAITARDGAVSGTVDAVVAAGGLHADVHFSTRDVVLGRRGQPQPFVLHPELRGSASSVTWRDGALTIGQLNVAGSPTIVDITGDRAVEVPFVLLSLSAQDVAWPTAIPARVKLVAQVADGGRATVEGRVVLATLDADLRARIEGVRLPRVAAYLPDDAPVTVVDGSASADLRVRRRPGMPPRMTLTGTLADLAVASDDEATPLVRAPRLDVVVDDLVAGEGDLSVAKAAVEGPLVLRPRGDPVPPLEVPAARIAVEDLRWPSGAAAPVRLAVTLPGEGQLDATGHVVPRGRRLTLAVTVDDAALAPYTRLLRLDAPVRGRVDAKGDLTVPLEAPIAFATSGHARITGIEVGPSDAAPISVEEIRIAGVDVRWPAAVDVARVHVVRPSVRVVRAEDGTFPLREMLRPRDAEGDEEAADGAASPGAVERPSVAIGAIHLEQGDARFVDRTIEPTYSEEITSLDIRVTGLRTADEAPAAVAVQGVVGADAALELRGEVRAFHDPLLLELRGTLTGFALPRTNPYVRHYLDWFIERGSLTTELHYRVIGDRLEATNELLVEEIRVEREPRSADPRRGLGIPLGLIVAIMADHDGDIRVTVPVSGNLASPEFDLGDAIAAAFKRLLSSVVTGPFRAIGRIFRGRDGEELPRGLEVDPLAFEPGLAVIDAEGEKHVQRVADFLRAAPRVQIWLRPVTTEADVEALRHQRTIGAIQDLRRREGLASFETAARRLFRERFPSRETPGTLDAIVGALRETVGPVDAAAADLTERRLETVRRMLVEEAGLEPGRVRASDARVPPGAPGAPRVEFDLRPPA